jgi:hypothetical protein
LSALADELTFESSSDSDDEEWDDDDPFAAPDPKIVTRAMREPMSEFHLDEHIA